MWPNPQFIILVLDVFRNLKSKPNLSLLQNKTIKRSYCCSDFFHKKTTNFNENLLYYVKNLKSKTKVFLRSEWIGQNRW